MGVWISLVVIVLTGCGAIPSHSASPNHRASQADPTRTAPAIPVGSSDHSIEVGGLRRTFIVYRPASLPAAASLVVMMHGGFGRGSQAEKSYGWDAEADSGHCPAGRTVELITIAGAGHQWPGAAPNRLAQLLLHTDPPSKALNATQVIWQFFAAHPR